MLEIECFLIKKRGCGNNTTSADLHLVLMYFMCTIMSGQILCVEKVTSCIPLFTLRLRPLIVSLK